MRIVCTICTDVVRDDCAAAPCGHTFHFTCLSQWLAHQKTCPQCRERCLPRNVIKLFLNDLLESSRVENESLNEQELKEKLELQQSLLKHKDEALSEARATLEQIKEEMQAWQSQHDALHKKLRTEKTVTSTLKKQLEVLQYECELTKELKKETTRLRERLSTMEGIQKVLTGSQEEIDTLVENYQSTSQLASFLVVLRKDYDVLKAKKSTLQKEKNVLSQELLYLKRKVKCREEELQSTRSQLNMLETDLHASEKEREGLTKKVEMLEKAIESPGSKVALRRILESPMPDASRGISSDLGASPLLVSRKNVEAEDRLSSVAEAGKNRPFKHLPLTVGLKSLTQTIGLKRQSDNAVILPNKVLKQGGTENFASGFNGMGGTSRFAIPRWKPKPPQAKGLKFAPRSHTLSHSSKPKNSQPLPLLKF